MTTKKKSKFASIIITITFIVTIQPTKQNKYHDSKSIFRKRGPLALFRRYIIAFSERGKSRTISAELRNFHHILKTFRLSRFEFNAVRLTWEIRPHFLGNSRRFGRTRTLVGWPEKMEYNVRSVYSNENSKK